MSNEEIRPSSVSLEDRSIDELVAVAMAIIGLSPYKNRLSASLEAIKELTWPRLEEETCRRLLSWLICYWWNSATIVQFVRWICSNWPLSLFLIATEDLTILLQSKNTDVKLLTDASDSFAILYLGHSAEIFALSAQAKSTNCNINNSAQLRDAINSADAHECLVNIDPLWAPCVMELLQLEIKVTNNDSHRIRCWRYLRKMAKEYEDLPSSLYLKGVTVLGDQPFSGGAYSDIYKGQYNGREVCLKATRYFLNDNEEKRKAAVAQFRREALTWTQLNHPNVLSLLGVNEQLFPARFCLVSWWMSKGNIVSFFQDHPKHDKFSSIMEIAQGIKYLHSLQPPLIHGDIKGANILVTDDHRCCLADFGVAVASMTQSLNSTSSGPRGTLRWLAPEVLSPGSFLSASQSDDTRSRDIYAFACTIFEIYSGEVPFEDKAEVACIYLVPQGYRPSRPEQCADDEVWALVEECWDQVWWRRPCAEKICNILDDISVRAGRSTPSDASMAPTHSPHSPSSPESCSFDDMTRDAFAVWDTEHLSYYSESDVEVLSSDGEEQSPLTSHITRAYPKRHFILKSSSRNDLYHSVHSTGDWCVTRKRLEKELDIAYEASEVYLIFTVNRSNEFYGYARMASAIRGLEDLSKRETKPYHSSNASAHWGAGRTNGNPQKGVSGLGVKSMGTPFRVEWIRTDRLPFYHTSDLRNPWINNSEVNNSKDGTELETSVGQKLIDRWESLPVSTPPSQYTFGQGFTHTRNPFVNSYHPLANQTL